MSLCATTAAAAEAQMSRACALPQEKPSQVCALQGRVAPCSLQLEKAHLQQQRPSIRKKKSSPLKKMKKILCMIAFKILREI